LTNHNNFTKSTTTHKQDTIELSRFEYLAELQS